MNATALGKLFLVPTPLDFLCDTQVPLSQVLPLATVQTASQIDHWVVENAKSARAFLKRVDAVSPLRVPLQAQQINELPRLVHKKGDWVAGVDMRGMLQAASQGHDIGLLSEAGMPAVADPGSSVVRAAHDVGIQVLPLVVGKQPMKAVAEYPDTGLSLLDAIAPIGEKFIEAKDLGPQSQPTVRTGEIHGSADFWFGPGAR